MALLISYVWYYTLAQEPLTLTTLAKLPHFEAPSSTMKILLFRDHLKKCQDIYNRDILARGGGGFSNYVTGITETLSHNIVTTKVKFNSVPSYRLTRVKDNNKMEIVVMSFTGFCKILTD